MFPLCVRVKSIKPLRGILYKCLTVKSEIGFLFYTKILRKLPVNFDKLQALWVERTSRQANHFWGVLVLGAVF